MATRVFDVPSVTSQTLTVASNAAEMTSLPSNENATEEAKVV